MVRHRYAQYAAGLTCGEEEIPPPPPPLSRSQVLTDGYNAAIAHSSSSSFGVMYFICSSIIKLVDRLAVEYFDLELYLSAPAIAVCSSYNGLHFSHPANAS